MIKQWIKRSFLWKIKQWCFDTIYDPKHLLLERELRESGDKILLVGTPMFNNLGDHLLAEKECQWLADHFPNKEVVEIPTPIFLRYESTLKELVQPEIPVYITGGGWMGDVWPDDERRMQRIISCFRKNPITVFPQTVYYEGSGTESLELLENARTVYQSCSNLTLCFRDRKSYDFACSNFQSENTKIRLLPDMGLYKISDRHAIKKKKIGVCLRCDREKITENLHGIIEAWAVENDYSTMRFSTKTKMYIPIWMRRNRIQQLRDQLGDVDIVVTDRLHGMIFGLMSGCKCVALDNKTNKVSGVYHEWLHARENVVLLTEPSEERLRSVLDRYHCR